MNMNMQEVFTQLEEDTKIPREVLIETIETALLSAYKKNFSIIQDDKISVVFDAVVNAFKVVSTKEVVEKTSNNACEIEYRKAVQYNSNIEIGQNIDIEITPKDFGRIAAQTAKQVIIQKIKEAEREIFYKEFHDLEGTIITGKVQKTERNNVLITFNNKEFTLYAKERIPGERYKTGDKIKILVVKVDKTPKDPIIHVSRAHDLFLGKLFEFEIPEIEDGTVEIKAITREPGARAKIAVFSEDGNIDPVGACVGLKGFRIRNIVNEINGEKIDIIRWSKDPKIFITNALSPARVVKMNVDENNKKTRVVVPDDQLSLAIGKEGQNVRLAAKLTNYKIDIINESAFEGEVE